MLWTLLNVSKLGLSTQICHWVLFTIVSDLLWSQSLQIVNLFPLWLIQYRRKHSSHSSYAGYKEYTTDNLLEATYIQFYDNTRYIWAEMHPFYCRFILIILWMLLYGYEYWNSNNWSRISKMVIVRLQIFIWYLHIEFEVFLWYRWRRIW